MRTTLKFSLPLGAILVISLLAAFHPVNQEEAIKADIEKETASYFQGDVEAWADCFKHDAQTVYVGSPLGGSTVLEGWDALDENVGKPRKASPDAWKMTVQRDNWQIRQSGNTAFVTYDQTMTFADWPGTNLTKELRCLEKVQGK